MRKRPLISAIGLIALLAAPSGASAETKKTPAAQVSWQVSKNGKAIGTEKVRAVVSATKARFSTSKYKPDGGAAIVSHIRRGPDGKLVKYERKKDVRQGPGIKAFARGSRVRIVGINQKFAAVDLDGAASYTIFDPNLSGPFYDWVRLLKGAGPVQVAYVDIAKRRTAMATATRGEPKSIWDGDGAEQTIAPWKIEGLSETVTLWIGKRRKLVAIDRGSKSLLLIDWTWVAPVVEPLAPNPDVVPGGDGAKPIDGAPVPTPDKPATPDKPVSPDEPPPTPKDSGEGN